MTRHVRNPVPSTGHALQQFDDEGTRREMLAKKVMRDISIPYPKQIAIMQRIEALRLSTLGIRGEPLPGLRLSQVSQAGKTKTLQTYILGLRAKIKYGKSEKSKNQVVYIGLKRRVTVKMFYQRLLSEMGDTHPDKGNLETLIQRAEEFLRKLGVELLIVDEVQHLANPRSDSQEVTDELKSFLDRGVVPVVFAGNEESRHFFENNAQLSARLGAPLELSPTNVRANQDAKMFKAFCIDLDRAITASGVVERLSNLGCDEVLRGLLIASSGHIGRVCRLVGAALEHAARRHAEFVEIYDLSFAIDNLALPSKWVSHNPFKKDVR
ncbi:MAG: TniB family NTP-binding protein [Sphingomonadaceae bacterium]